MYKLRLQYNTKTSGCPCTILVHTAALTPALATVARSPSRAGRPAPPHAAPRRNAALPDAHARDPVAGPWIFHGTGISCRHCRTRESKHVVESVSSETAVVSAAAAGRRPLHQLASSSRQVTPQSTNEQPTMNTGPGQALDLRLGLTKPDDTAFPLRWGIIGCGNISACWCESLRLVEGAT